MLELLKLNNSFLVDYQTRTRISRYLNLFLECLWLLAVILVPLAFLGRNYAVSEAEIGFVEVPKVALMRTLAGLMGICWIIDWSLRVQWPSKSLFVRQGALLQPNLWAFRLTEWLRLNPARVLALAIALYLFSVLISTALSGSFKLSLWGEVPGQDGYSAYTMVSYGVICAVVMTHLKTRRQLVRLLGSAISVGTIVAGYAIFQHYGYDFLRLSVASGGGNTSFMGNVIFAAAVVIMTIPITLACATNHLAGLGISVEGIRGKVIRSFYDATAFTFWITIVTIQLLGVLVTFSRAPALAMLIALLVFILVIAGLLGWRIGGRSMLAVAAFSSTDPLRTQMY